MNRILRILNAQAYLFGQCLNIKDGAAKQAVLRSLDKQAGNSVSC